MEDKLIWNNAWDIRKQIFFQSKIYQKKTDCDFKFMNFDLN